MSKPKIAVLIDWYLPGTKAGGPVRSVYSLVNLLKDDFDFYIITTNCDLGENIPYENIVSNQLIETNGIQYFYFSANNLNSSSLTDLFQKIQPSLIYLNSFWSYHFSINVVNLKHKNRFSIPVLLAPRGMLGKGALGLKSFKKRAFIALVRLLGWYKQVVFHATQQQEEKDVHAKFPKARVIVAPNINSSPARQNNCVKTKNQLRLFYLSRIARVKNLHFAIESLQHIPSHFEVVYDIYGNLEDTAYWTECLALIKSLPKNVTVSYSGELPFHQVQQTICNYHALLLPTLNENFGHSIVESLLTGCLVIISDQTPWNDVEPNGVGFAIDLNERQKFTDCICSLASMDQKDFREKSNKAINYINTKIDLNATANQYKNMFNECIKN